MKILYYSHTSHVSGAERVLLMILKNLNRDRFAPAVACPPGNLVTRCRSLGIETHPIEESRVRFTWHPHRLIGYLSSLVASARSFRKLIRDLSPDLIHANSVRSGIIVSAATVGMRIPVIWHVHDVLRRHPISPAIRWFALLRCPTIVAVSNATARRFLGVLLRPFRDRVRVKTVHNGIELEEFRPDPDERCRKRIELGISDSAFAIGIVGQITPRKGHLELLRSFATVVRNLPNAELLIVGAPLFNNDAAYLELLQHECKRLGIEGCVRFLGARQDVAGILQALDLLVLNSRSEPFSIVLLEALASGTPVLATAVDGVPELIDDGESGFLIEPGRPEDLSFRIVEIARNATKRAAVGSQGRLHVEAGFGSARFQRDIEAVYATPAKGDSPVHQGRASN